MHFLKSFILKFSILASFSLLISCSESVNFDQIISSREPLNVVIILKTDRTMLGEKTATQILPDSKDFRDFQNWLHQNNSGWNETIASFEKQNMIIQKDFELYYMGYFVAISYKDAEGKSHQLNKTVEVGSLDFLFD